MTIRSPDEAFAVYQSEFDSAWRHGGLWIGVWHPWLTARLARAEKLVEFIRYMMAKGDVWIAPMEEIARHVRSAIDNGTYQARKVEMPYYRDPIDAAKVPQQRKP